MPARYGARLSGGLQRDRVVASSYFSSSGWSSPRQGGTRWTVRRFVRARALRYRNIRSVRFHFPCWRVRRAGVERFCAVRLAALAGSQKLRYRFFAGIADRERSGDNKNLRRSLVWRRTTGRLVQAVL